jgi:hypothetical protein
MFISPATYPITRFWNVVIFPRFFATLMRNWGKREEEI